MPVSKNQIMNGLTINADSEINNKELNLSDSIRLNSSIYVSNSKATIQALKEELHKSINGSFSNNKELDINKGMDQSLSSSSMLESFVKLPLDEKQDSIIENFPFYVGKYEMEVVEENSLDAKSTTTERSLLPKVDLMFESIVVIDNKPIMEKSLASMEKSFVFTNNEPDMERSLGNMEKSFIVLPSLAEDFELINGRTKAKGITGTALDYMSYFYKNRAHIIFAKGNLTNLLNTYSTVTTVLYAPYISAAVMGGLIVGGSVEYALTNKLTYSTAAIGAISIFCGLGGAIPFAHKGSVAAVKGVSAAVDVLLPGPLKIIPHAISSIADLSLSKGGYIATAGIFLGLYELLKTDTFTNCVKTAINENIRQLVPQDLANMTQDIAPRSGIVSRLTSKATAPIKSYVEFSLLNYVVNAVTDKVEKVITSLGENKQASWVNTFATSGENYVKSLVNIPQAILNSIKSNVELKDMEKSFIKISVKPDIEMGMTR